MRLLLLHNRPNEGAHPPDERPAEEKVDQKDSQRVTVMANGGHDGRNKINDQADDETDDADKAAEEPLKGVWHKILLARDFRDLRRLYYKPAPGALD